MTDSEGAVAGPTLADRYSAIFGECMALAEVWRRRAGTEHSDKGFYADQHRRAILRAAAFARFAARSERQP